MESTQNDQTEDFEFDFDSETYGTNRDDKIDDRFIKLQNKAIICRQVNYNHARRLARDIKIQRGETIFCNLNGRFIFGDFIGAFIQENNLSVVELTVMSLSGGIDNLEMLEALKSRGWVQKVNLVLSEYFLRTEQAKHTDTIAYLKKIKECHGDGFNIYYTNTHAKLTLIKTEKEGENGYVVMHGSANLRSSQSLEQLIIHENKELYDFNYEYFNNLKK